MSDLLINREEFAKRGIFSLAWSSLTKPRELLLFFYIASILASTILCINAIWVLTGSPETLLSSWLSGIAPLGMWVSVFAGYFLLALILAAVTESRPLRILIYMLATWLAGVYAIRAAQPFIPYPSADLPFQDYGDALGAMVYRLSFVAPVVPMFIVYWIVEKGDRAYPLRIGNLFRKTAIFRSGGKGTSWAVWVLRIWLFVALPLFIMFQMQAGFEPLKSGKVLVFLVPILALALMNALSEDLILQGFILPNEARILAPGLAILLHGLFFGLMHWGSAPDAISGLPQGLVIGFLVWVASKAVLETGGLGYSVLGHMSVDVAIFSGHFI